MSIYNLCKIWHKATNVRHSTRTKLVTDWQSFTRLTLPIIQGPEHTCLYGVKYKSSGNFSRKAYLSKHPVFTVIFEVSICPNPPPRAGRNTRSVFFSGVGLVWFRAFFLTDCSIKTEEPMSDLQFIHCWGGGGMKKRILAKRNANSLCPWFVLRSSCSIPKILTITPQSPWKLSSWSYT